MAAGLNGVEIMVKIDRIIEEIDRLTPVSNIGERMMQIASDPSGTLADVVDLVRYDQAMTANLLKICNSAYLGLTRKVTSVSQAVTYLGINKVASLVMMGSSADNFREANAGYDLRKGELWRYSVSSALIAQDIAERVGLSHGALVFTSALLKDIGKVILNRFVGNTLEEINRMVEKESLTFIEAEKRIIGIDHAELGARVAEKWNFGPDMVHIIRHHHVPGRAREDLCLAVVYLSDCICMMMGNGVGADGLAYRYDQDVVDRLNISDIDLQKIMAGFRERLRAVEELVSLSGGS